MKASEYIVELQKLIDEHGDLEMERYGNNGRITAKPPEIAYRKILNKRESRDEFWSKFHGENQKGEKVFRI